MSRYFEKVTADVTMCPNLTLEPFNLAAAGKKFKCSQFASRYLKYSILAFTGLCGDTAIMDVGGLSYAVPFPRKEKWWHIENLLTQAHRNHDSFVIGSGITSQPFMPHNGEVGCIYNRTT